jgi:hypothetical protein
VTNKHSGIIFKAVIFIADLIVLGFLLAYNEGA